MKVGPESVIRFFQLLALILLLSVLPPSASAQKSAPPPPPKRASAPSRPAPVQHPAGHDNPGHPGVAPAAGHSGGDNGKTGGSREANHTNTNSANNHTATGPNTGGNRTTGGSGNANHADTNTNNRNNPSPPPKPAPTANETTIRVITPNPTAGKPAANSKLTGNTSVNSGKPGVGGSANKNASTNANWVNNQPGTHPLPNGGTRTVKSNGSAVEKNKDGKVTGVTTAKGVAVKLDAHGHPAAIHDGHGTTISRGPHGERRVETVRGDHSRLVSTGRHRGFDERHFSQGGRDYARRSYYDHGHYYARVYRPFYYGGYAYYSYVPPYYYGPAYYGWAYNGWPVPVLYSWGWYGSPWYVPYGYYFSPYPVYPAPAFWLADYAIAASLQAAAEEAGSTSLRHEPGFVLASAHPDGHKNDGGSVAMTKELKDMIAKQVKIIIADEKAAAAAQGNLPPDEDAQQVPPSLDPRFKLFIASSSASLDTDDGACALTAGDIVLRTKDTPDADNTVGVEVVSSKNDDCAVGTASRMTVDDLEEMHDSFRQKVDDGLKSLSENQGKGGIPSGPAATQHTLPEGQATPDLTVEADLEKQQEAADATENDVQDLSSDGGSAD